ncbi:MAG: acetate--CoA ligase family protein [Candidatus Eisenbacteria bacterium]|uniref:Acetate--CoA ligase family protein n=1 Tax=Eiseniibacteriota bacterium TaxID=2212470 RepID=A0A948W5K6_UNCEI|nr:acetate--CoA ligase family protein [Candidatus Eisenbacteria bacterium]MBU1950434.1 acetate--CoA ligase family protein [Candidatus Eisenbacteria bacterium]MBU2690100.1 acetate--CoA ligase family protein [Candidatus Eisenbacteria bacterium]
MARIIEAKGKEILQKAGLPTPKGRVATTPAEARSIAAEIGGECVLKAQILVTGRAAKGLIRFAKDVASAEKEARDLLGRVESNQTVVQVLVEEKVDVAKEYFAAVLVDDRLRAPRILFSSRGGSGIEEIAKKYPESVIDAPIDILTGLQAFEARDLVRKVGISGRTLLKLGDFLPNLYKAFRQVEARTIEVNPILETTDGRLIAGDCHLTVDDYAVFRHPELGITMARELDHTPTPLEMAAYRCEQEDYRGTFYFFQMAQGFKAGEGYVGFHGAGGGGSMMSMDALQKFNFKPANFCDTSGNPPASKVYRAAKVILQQKEIDGYFASGSGVASQEQFQSARGMIKAFRELNLSVPAVIRLGGNAEEIAIDILHKYGKDLPAPVEAYGKDDSAVFCAERLRDLVDNWKKPKAGAAPVTRIGNQEAPDKPYKFATMTGSLTIDHAKCVHCTNQVCIPACPTQILALNDNKAPVLAVTEEVAKKGRCTECLACELACWDEAENAIHIDLPIPGLEETSA